MQFPVSEAICDHELYKRKDWEQITVSVGQFIRFRQDNNKKSPVYKPGI
jgi:hypothetical protein